MYEAIAIKPPTKPSTEAPSTAEGRALESSVVQGVRAVHVLVGEVPPVLAFLSRHVSWFGSVREKVVLAPLGKRPDFADYFAYALCKLPGQMVVLLNQDIFVAASTRISSIDPGPGHAWFISRHSATLEEGRYERAESTAALAATVGNQSVAADGVLHAKPCSSESPGSTCLRGKDYVGALDGYAFRVDANVLRPELTSLLRYPNNADGGENTLVLFFRHCLNVTVTNPCLSLRFVHLHCARTDRTSTAPGESDHRLWRDVIHPRASRVVGHELGGAGVGHLDREALVWPSSLEHERAGSATLSGS